MDMDFLKSSLIETIPWVKMSDIRVDVFEKRRVRLSVPVREKHLNHVGIVYAGTHFMLMEVAGAALFVTTYGIERFIPINKGMSIRYLKPAYTDLACELTLTEEDAAARIKPVEEKGRGDWILDMTVTDETGNTVSTSQCNYYLISTGSGLTPR
jgi:uncharacterized protein (TIGR00369 family)